MRPAHLKAALGDPLRNCLGVMQWRSRMIEQTRNTLLLKTRQPLVSHPPAPPQPPAYPRKRFLLLLPHPHKPQPPFHRPGPPPLPPQSPPCPPFPRSPFPR